MRQFFKDTILPAEGITWEELCQAAKDEGINTEEEMWEILDDEMGNPGFTEATFVAPTFKNEWGVKVKIGNDGKTSYGAIRSEVYGMPVTSMECAFEGCSKMIESPAIPSTVTNLHAAYFTCFSLERPPVIPDGVTDMSSTFSACSALTEAPVIPASVENMDSSFVSCTSLSGQIKFSGMPDNMSGMCSNTQNEIVLIFPTNPDLDNLAYFEHKLNAVGGDLVCCRHYHSWDVNTNYSFDHYKLGCNLCGWTDTTDTYNIELEEKVAKHIEQGCDSTAVYWKAIYVYISAFIHCSGCGIDAYAKNLPATTAEPENLEGIEYEGGEAFSDWLVNEVFST